MFPNPWQRECELAAATTRGAVSRCFKKFWLGGDQWKNSIRQAIFLRQDRLGHPSCLNNDDLGSSDGQGHLSSRMTVRATLAFSRSRVSRCAAEREDSHTGAAYSAVGGGGGDIRNVQLPDDVS